MIPEKSRYPNSRINTQTVDYVDSINGEERKHTELSIERKPKKQISITRLLSGAVCIIIVSFYLLARIKWHSHGDIFNDAPLIGGHLTVGKGGLTDRSRQ